MKSTAFDSHRPVPLLPSGTDCESTSTEGPSPTSVYETPFKSNAGYETLDSLFARIKLSPPAKSDECHLDWIKQQAKQIFDFLPEEDHPKCCWESLKPVEQAALAFLIFKNQHKILAEKFPEDMRKVAKEITSRVLEIRTTDEDSTLAAFILEDGDLFPSTSHERWDMFLNKHPEWKTHQSSFTIFTHDNILSKTRVEFPFVRVQNINSTVCYIISAAQIVLYFMILKTGSTLKYGIDAWGINIGRFLRNNLTDEQIFRAIFEDGSGPTSILHCLLTHDAKPDPSMCEDCANFRPIRIDAMRTAEFVYQNLLGELAERGPLLVEGFRTFPAYFKTDITEFSGDWNELKSKTATILHAAVVVGIIRTKDDVMGGMKFLLQDSMPERPFVAVGRDLLLSMGIKDVFGLELDVSFRENTDLNKFDKTPGSTYSGTPTGKCIETFGEAETLEDSPVDRL